MWTLEIVLERQKTGAEGHSQTLTQSDLVFINPGIYINRLSLTAELSERQKTVDKLNKGEMSEAHELRLTTGLFLSFSNFQKQ